MQNANWKAVNEDCPAEKKNENYEAELNRIKDLVDKAERNFTEEVNYRLQLESLKNYPSCQIIIEPNNGCPKIVLNNEANRIIRDWLKAAISACEINRIEAIKQIRSNENI